MNTKLSYFLSILLFLFIAFTIEAQDIKVYNFIGKKTSVVLKKYGKPAFRDKSNPNMDCMFYQSKTKKIVFVSDADGVYQAEASAYFNSKKAAKKTLNKVIRNSVLNKFMIDTLSVNNFSLQKKGVIVELHFARNIYKKKYEVYLKAMRYIE